MGSDVEAHPERPLTILFTDIESSTRMWQDNPDAMAIAIARHDGILRGAIEGNSGTLVKSTGDGVMAVFLAVVDGVRACLDAQIGMYSEPWSDAAPICVRMALNVGSVRERDGDYFGPPVNRAARIVAAANGGQILLSASAAALAEGRLPPQVELRDLGEHSLKDLSQPERLYQLVSPELPEAFPSLRTLSQRPNNLPTQSSEFFGRDEQLRAIRGLLDSQGIRLLTLLGPGGIGKTRLALQAAADQIDRFADGVYFVDLAPVRNPEAVYEAIARTLDLNRASSELAIDALKRELKDRHILLLLDNLEQVIDAADGIVDLLQHCSMLKVLVTSREALNVRGEHLFIVPPLAIPAPGEARSVEAVADFEGVRLFVERAREARPDFMLSEENLSDIVEISTRLDGLPLALELAASRLRLFSPGELRDRLRTRLDSLGSGARDLPARQRTLRSTIEWSYELLDQEERETLLIMSMFSSATIDAVEAVASRIDPSMGLDTVDQLTSLIDKSLIRRLERPGQQRLTLLETIREYAAERLEEQEELARNARRAYAEHFSHLAEQMRDRLHSSDRDRALSTVESEAGNLERAWNYWVRKRDLEQLNRMLDALWAYYSARGLYHAALALTNQLIEMLDSIPESSARTTEEITLRSVLARGLSAVQGYTAEVESIYKEALRLANEHGELPQRFPVLRNLADFYLYSGEFDRAAELGQAILDLAEDHQASDYPVHGHLLIGCSSAFTSKMQQGLDHLDQAIASFDPRGGPRSLYFGASAGVVSHTTSALLLWLVGHPEQAVARATRAVVIARELQNPYSLVYGLFHAGFLDLWRGELDLVYERAQEALEIAREQDYQIWKALGLILEGVALAGKHQPDDGIERIERGVALYQGLETPPVFWPLLLYLRSTGFALANHHARALELVEQAIEFDPDGILSPEFLILKGNLQVARSQHKEAIETFRRASNIAHETGVRWSGLRAASRLTRLLRESGGANDESERLRNFYQTLREGFDTPELVEARNLLDST